MFLELFCMFILLVVHFDLVPHQPSSRPYDAGTQRNLTNAIPDRAIFPIVKLTNLLPTLNGVNGNPSPIIFFLGDADQFVFELENAVMPIDLGEKKTLNDSLQMARTVAAGSGPALGRYIERMTAHVDRAVSSSRYAAKLAQSSPLVSFPVTQLPFWHWRRLRAFFTSSSAYPFVCKGCKSLSVKDRRLQQAMVTTLEMYTALQSIGTAPQPDILYHILAVLDSYLEEVVNILSLPKTDHDQRLVSRDWTFANYTYKNDLKDRIRNNALRLRKSISALSDHLAYLQDTINGIDIQPLYNLVNGPDIDFSRETAQDVLFLLIHGLASWQDRLIDAQRM